MIWISIILYVWLWSFVIVPPVLYVGYGFVMAAMRARDLPENPSPAWVVKIDAVIAGFFILLDGYYNAFCLPFLCADFRPSMAFRTVTRFGVTFPVFELMTERLSRYNENPTEWAYRRAYARALAPLLDAKDPKGWHLRQAPKP